MCVTDDMNWQPGCQSGDRLPELFIKVDEASDARLETVIRHG